MSTLFNDSIKHQILMERVKAGEARKMLEKMAEHDKKIFALISALPNDYNKRHLNNLLSEIKKKNLNFYKKHIIPALRAIARKTVTIEIDSQHEIIKDHLSDGAKVTKPNKNIVFDVAMGTKFQGKTLEKWAEDLHKDKTNRISRTVKTMSVDFEDAGKIVNASKQQIKIANNNLSTVTKSFIGHFSNVSKDFSYSSNNDIVDEILWSSILDHRTTTACGARSNKRYNARTKKPIGHKNKWNGGPGALHWGCRSHGIPINSNMIIVEGSGKGNNVFDGDRTAIGGSSDYQKGDNFKDNGKVYKFPSKNNNLQKQVIPAHVDYEDWLRDQPKEFIEDVLGSGKAKLFLDKKMSIQEFVVPDGRELTLDKIAA